MYKHAHRVLLTLSNKVRSGVMLSTTGTGFLNNNFVMPILSVSKISLSALTCRIAKRNYSAVKEDSDSDCESDSGQYSNKPNPSVEVQKKIQQEAQERLEDLLTNDPDLNKFYKILELEIEVLRQSGSKVPSTIKATDWLHLIKTKTQSSRRRFLEFIWINEVKRKSGKMKRQAAVLLKKSLEEKDVEENELDYGLRNNTMFTRIYKTVMSQVLNQKLITAMMFGEKLVIDCGFESHMTYREISSCAKQLMFSFVANRAAKFPFDMHLCNLDPKGELKRRLLSFFPTMDDPAYPLNTTSQSYLELFPKEKLVYLTPHTSHVMQKYNPDDIYIIGGIVDKRDSKPLSMAKAKEEGLRVAKFPLDNYLDWKAGSGKNLNLNHCVKILVDFKATNDWEHALKVVPSRKIIRPYTAHDNTPRIVRTFQNFEPKFQSGQASHVPDLAYYSKESQNKRNR